MFGWSSLLCSIIAVWDKLDVVWLCWLPESPNSSPIQHNIIVVIVIVIVSVGCCLSGLSVYAFSLHFRKLTNQMLSDLAVSPNRTQHPCCCLSSSHLLWLCDKKKQFFFFFWIYHWFHSWYTFKLSHPCCCIFFLSITRPLSVIRGISCVYLCGAWGARVSKPVWPCTSVASARVYHSSRQRYFNVVVVVVAVAADDMR